MSKVNAGLFTSDSSEWETPRKLFNELNRYFDFTIDVASTDDNALTHRHYTKANSAFDHKWKDERCFMNPPYGRDIKQWVQKAAEEAKHNGALVVCLLPSRTDTHWFHDYAINGNLIFLKGRLKFEFNGQPMGSAPFPSMICLFHDLVGDHMERVRTFHDGFSSRRIYAAVK